MGLFDFFDNINDPREVLNELMDYTFVDDVDISNPLGGFVEGVEEAVDEVAPVVAAGAAGASAGGVPGAVTGILGTVGEDVLFQGVNEADADDDTIGLTSAVDQIINQLGGSADDYVYSDDDTIGLTSAVDQIINQSGGATGVYTPPRPPRPPAPQPNAETPMTFDPQNPWNPPRPTATGMYTPGADQTPQTSNTSNTSSTGNCNWAYYTPSFPPEPEYFDDKKQACKDEKVILDTMETWIDEKTRELEDLGRRYRVRLDRYEQECSGYEEPPPPHSNESGTQTDACDCGCKPKPQGSDAGTQTDPYACGCKPPPKPQSSSTGTQTDPQKIRCTQAVIDKCCPVPKTPPRRRCKTPAAPKKPPRKPAAPKCKTPSKSKEKTPRKRPSPSRKQPARRVRCD